MQTIFKSLLVAIVTTTLLIPSMNNFAMAKEPDKLVFGLNWLWYGVHGVFIPALKLGYYKEANLDVDIKRGYGSGDAIKRAYIGQADIALADLNSLVVARSQGVPVKAIAVLENLAPHCVIARRDHGIKTLKDLEGKTFAGSKTDGNIIMLPTPLTIRLRILFCFLAKWMPLGSLMLEEELDIRRSRSGKISIFPGFPITNMVLKHMVFPS